jgi:hypothetical protein
MWEQTLVGNPTAAKRQGNQVSTARSPRTILALAVKANQSVKTGPALRMVPSLVTQMVAVSGSGMSCCKYSSISLNRVIEQLQVLTYRRLLFAQNAG